MTSTRQSRVVQLRAGFRTAVSCLAAAVLAGLHVAASEAPPAPLSVELATEDGVLLRGAFFPARKPTNDTPVVVMLADVSESPAVFDPLAIRLQGTAGDKAPSIATLAIALRGQGDSTRVRRPGGEIDDLRGAKVSPADAKAMVRYDMEAVRKFLVDKNDAREINLNRLGYVGVGLGAIVATNAAAVDWAVPILSRGKQGRDVKALVLVSPPWKQLGLEMLRPLRQAGVRSQVAVLLTYGGEDRSASEAAERIVKQLEADRPKPPAPAEGEPEPLPSVVNAPGASRLQGAEWLKLAGENGRAAIVRFLQRTLAEPEYPWVERRLK